MSSVVSLKKYKKDFENLYILAEEGEIRDAIQLSISQIDDLLHKDDLQSNIINLYSDFFGNLVSSYTDKVVPCS